MYGRSLSLSINEGKAGSQHITEILAPCITTFGDVQLFNKKLLTKVTCPIGRKNAVLRPETHPMLRIPEVVLPKRDEFQINQQTHRHLSTCASVVREYFRWKLSTAEEHGQI
jgi:hypothetical protein